MRILQYSLLVAVLILNDFSVELTTALDCHYYDTVDLTGIQPFPNGSYLYENLIIPAELTGEYDYRLTGDDDERIEVAKYIRGCACRLKSCVRFCCHHNLMFMHGECIGDTDTALEYDPYLNITMSDGRVVEKHVLNEFIVQRHLPLPCFETGTYYLDDRIDGYEWSLFENGSFIRTYDGVSFDKREYCLQPLELPNNEIRLVPHNCQIPSQSNIFAKIVIPISLVSFLITIAVYLYLPKLRNLHGKCFVCYLISLFIGYSMLLLDIYKACINYLYLCYLTGYLGYFGILAAFFWLTVISLDLWNSFRGTNYNVNRITSGHRFLIYNLYAWGMPLLLTILIAILDQVLLDVNAEDLTWVPGVYYSGCWIKTFDWSAMVYFYGPMLILIIFNTLLFIQTAARIMVIKKRYTYGCGASGSSSYSLFVRLFVIMGVSWSLEIISYLVQHHTVLSYIFLISDYFHYAQGIVILILFVLKRSVLKLFIDRFNGQQQTHSAAFKSRTVASTHPLLLRLRNKYTTMLITHKRVLSVVILIMLSTADLAWSQLDCHYYDTVDLTGIQPFPNGSYLYENLIIPAELTGEYDYRLTGDDDERIEVAKYIRGCACRLKSCVRFCCHHNLMFMHGECIGDTDTALEYDPYLNITMSDGRVVEKHVLNEFIVQRHLPLPCFETGTYYLDDRIDGYEWSLFENGSFIRTYDGVSFDKREYCLQPLELPNNEIRLVPHNCQIPSQSNIFAKIVIPISLVSFLITIAVYLYLPKLRNLHGKCFVCFLISLFIGYSMLLLDIYKASIEHFYLCYLTGYLGYFGILAAFFWLTVISLDLWNSFRGTNYNVNRLTSGHRFLIYNLYAWGMPLLLTILIAILDQVLLDPSAEDLTWIPGVYYSGCWIKTFDWSAMVYFYGPMLILIIFNTTLFILVAVQIVKVKKELYNIVQRQERKQKLNSDKQNYSFFLRLIIIMGISWSFEIVSYFAANDSLWKRVLLSADFFHYSEGWIILIFFVLKPNIYHACLARIRGNDSQGATSFPSSRSLLKKKSTTTHKESSV
ncbi:uncharacterized protein [Drosophila tropicalis]|uniref:uncharacterized protein n=1 Tax=Drosophila tropicalis TaxID=46794 RepID=UPI0035ABCE11